MSPVAADEDCISPSNIPDSWKNHFPFDMVYPQSTLPTTALSGSTCPTYRFFGEDRELCTPMQLTKVLKNAFVLRMGIKAVFSI